MFVIFGWGHQARKEFGATLPAICPNCGNKCYWHLTRVRVWFTLFFIPVIPYSSQHWLLCEVCSRGIELTGDQVPKAIRINQTTNNFLGSAMTELEYWNTLHADLSGDQRISAFLRHVY